jgi:hypothetical protein
MRLSHVLALAFPGRLARERAAALCLASADSRSTRVANPPRSPVPAARPTGRSLLAPLLLDTVQPFGRKR